MLRFVRCTLAVSLLVALILPGCAASADSPRSLLLLNYPHATQETLTQSGDEHLQAVSNIAERDARALVEDFDLLFMTDRPTRLTRWHSR